MLQRNRVGRDPLIKTQRLESLEGGK